MAVISHSPPSQNNGIVITKAKLFLFASLALTWWIASLLPSYQPMIRAQFKSRLDEARQAMPTIKIDWKVSDDPRAAYNASKTAMIIEPRVMPHLVSQLLHMITVVPPDWRFLYVGSPESVTMLTRSTAVKHQQIIGKLDLMVLPEPWDISSKEMVFRTLTDMRFYDEFLPGVEWLLKYEYDSILCANSEVSLNEWLDWHWAGAPRTKDDRFSGNGGLSLRRVSAIRKILGFQARYNDTTPEDEWFGERLYITPGLKVASGLDGALAVENVYIEKPMGYHVQEMGENLPVEVWGNYEQRKKIFEYCPELYTVLSAKLDRERCPGDTKDGVEHPTAFEKQLEAMKQAEEIENRRKAAEEIAAKLEEAQKKIEEETKAREEAATTTEAAATATESTVEALTIIAAADAAKPTGSEGAVPEWSGTQALTGVDEDDESNVDKETLTLIEGESTSGEEDRPNYFLPFPDENGGF